MRLAVLRSFIAGLFRRDRVELDLADEVEFHLEARVRDLIRRGLSPAEARRRARLEFGSIERYKEDVRHARGLGLIDELRSDLLYGWRALRRAPGFTFVAALSLALGIGANTLVFSLLDSTLLRPLNLPDSDRLVAIWTVPADNPDQLGTSSIQRFFALRDRTQSFDAIVGRYVDEILGPSQPLTTLGERAGVLRLTLASDEDVIATVHHNLDNVGAIAVLQTVTGLFLHASGQRALTLRCFSSTKRRGSEISD